MQADADRLSFNADSGHGICSAFDQTLWNQDLSDSCLHFLSALAIHSIPLKSIQIWLATCISNLYRFAICMCKVLIQEIAFIAV